MIMDEPKLIIQGMYLLGMIMHELKFKMFLNLKEMLTKIYLLILQSMKVDQLIQMVMFQLEMI